MQIEEKITQVIKSENKFSALWKKIEPKLGFIFLFAVILIDQIWKNQPEWVGELIFWLGITWAVLSSETLQEALGKYSAWLANIQKTKAALTLAKQSVEATEKELLSISDIIEEVLLNDPPEKRMALVNAIQPLVGKLVEGKEALIFLCDTITEIDTKRIP